MHKFIHTLNKAQKRNLGRNLSEEKKDFHFEVFHFLNKQVVYDKAAFDVFLKKSNRVTGVSKVIADLFDEIEKIHHLQAAEGNLTVLETWVRDFDKTLQRIKTLYSLGAGKEAMQHIDKLKKKAKKYDYLMLELRTREEESLFHNYTNFRFTTFEEQVKLNQEYLEAIKKHEYLVQHKQLYYRLKYYLLKNDLEEAEKIIYRLDEIKNKVYDSHYSQLFSHMIKAQYYSYANDKVSGKSVLESFHIFLDDSLIYIETDFETYFTQKSNICMMQIHLLDIASIPTIISAYEEIINHKLFAGQQITIQNKLAYLHKLVLIRLQLMAIYKDNSLCNSTYIKSIEEQLVNNEKQLFNQQKSEHFLVNLLYLTFFKIILKDEESVMDYISFIGQCEVSENYTSLFKMHLAMITLMYYYTFLDRKIFEIQFANFKRTKSAKSGEGIKLLIAFFNAIKRHKYQRNRRCALEYYDLFKDFEKASNNFIKVSFWLKELSKSN